MIWTGTPPSPVPFATPFLPRLYDPTSNRETLAKRSFPTSSFYWLERLCTVGVLGHHRFQREAAGKRTATLVLWMLVYIFRGVPPPSPSPSPRPSVLTCVSLPPSLPPPPPTLRPPLISGLRGSRNERSEARWHEEGRGGWVVAGNCSKLRYRDLATLTPLCATPFPVLRSAVPHRRLIPFCR